MKKSKLILPLIMAAVMLLPVGCKTNNKVSSVVSQASDASSSLVTTAESSEDSSEIVISGEESSEVISSEEISSEISTVEEVSSETIIEDSSTTEASSAVENKYLAKYDFTTLTGTGSKITDTSIFTLVDGITAITANTVYDGNGTGGAKADATGLLKFGTSKAKGELTFTLAEGVAVTKVVVNCHSFYAASDSYPTNTTNYVAVNGEVKVAPYNSDATPEDVVFELNATGEVKIESCNADDSAAGRICVYSITLY